MSTLSDINKLHKLSKEKKLRYRDVIQVVNKLGLSLAEYGDGADYSNAEAYAYWNKTGNRKDLGDIYIEYDFDIQGETGKKTKAGTVHFIDEVYTT